MSRPTIESPAGVEPSAAVEGPRSRIGLALGLTALALAGAAIGLLPHAANLVKLGDVNYVADGDQVLYMAWSRDALLHGKPYLIDSVNPESGSMMHPWLVFVPPALLARTLGAGVRTLPVVWRALGGAGLGLGLYAVLWPALRDRRLAFGMSALLLFDSGFLFGQPVYRTFLVLGSLWYEEGAEFFDHWVIAMPHLRVVASSLTLPFLLAHYGLVLQARATGSRAWTIGAAASFGLLFYVYFYYWSTVLAGAVIAFLVDPKGRRLYATIIVVGLMIGLPELIHGSLIKASYAPDWLLRTDKFVPIGRLQELLVSKVTLAILAVTGIWVFRYRRDLVYLWSCALAGFVCLNHQIVTGLQIENYHWKLAEGPTFSVLLAALVAPLLFGRDRLGLALLTALVAVQTVVGVGFRLGEGVRPAETRLWSNAYETLKADRVAPPVGAVLAGDATGVMAASAYHEVYVLAGKIVEFSSKVDDAEFDERLMLNMYLSGLSRDDARREVQRPAGSLSWEAATARSEPLARVQLARRLALIDRVWADPAASAARFGVSHVLLPAETPPPTEALRAVGPARLVSKGRYWQLWQVEPKPTRAD